MKTNHLKYMTDKFKQEAEKQELKGIKKYGKPLDPLDNYDWLKMALEEQVDGTTYLVAEMRKRKFIVDKIRKLLETRHEENIDEIHYWLDELEHK